MGFFYKAAGGGEGVEEYANYDALPSSTEGATARTTNTNQTWRFSTACSCWVPSDFYSSGLAIANDTGSNPINFTSPQISDFSGLSGYHASGTVTDVAGGVEVSGTSSVFNFSREATTGDCLLIFGIDYTSGGTQPYYLSGLTLTSNVNPGGHIRFFPGGANKALTNQMVTAQAFGTLGSQTRPDEGISYSNGDLFFFKWNEQELTNRNEDQLFAELRHQDTASPMRSNYLWQTGSTTDEYFKYTKIACVNYTSGYSVKLTRLQFLKYT